MEKLLNEKVMANINEEALRAKTTLDEIASKRRIEEEKRLRRKKLEEEEERRRRIEKVKSISLQEIANESYLLSFKTLLERLQENNELDCSEEALKIKLDLVEQLNNMKKKHPSLDTVCHIESNKIYNSTRFRYWVMKAIFRRKKYRIIFHSKNVENDVYFFERISTGCFTILILFFIYLFSLIVMYNFIGDFIDDYFLLMTTLGFSGISFIIMMLFF